MDFLRKNLGEQLDERYALEEIRKAQAREVEFENIRKIKRDVLPSERLFKLVKPAWAERYEYRLRMAGSDEFGNKLPARYVSYRSNFRMSRQELLNDIRARYGSASSAGCAQMDIDDVLIVEAYQNANLI